MGENAEIRVKFEIGEIKFEAEGSADLVERERSIFNNTLLPSAVKAIVSTRGVTQAAQHIEANDYRQLVTDLNLDNNEQAGNLIPVISSKLDLSRTSLASYIEKYGTISELDFVMIAAYYDEKKNNVQSFTSENVKQYYLDARRQKYSNNSVLLNQLAQKGLIMDAPNEEKKYPKQYILTGNGINYVESYKPNEAKEDKQKQRQKRAKKTKSKMTSIYSSLNADDFKQDRYTEIKNQSTFKKQMILAMYIVTCEKKGEKFSVADVEHIMIHVLGLNATKKQISGVFSRNRDWFHSEVDSNNKKASSYKLLQGAKDFAQEIIEDTM
ncbi:hypothetical protein L0903_002893 [Listeria innocua]|nr:hypothetical protein [Listeria innocua]EIS4930966.1 hypothetical protein [Listeria innocua]EIS4933881.1 hypothetical protein [Listeria innocua]EIS4942652.1 hypothetical protein [Listeria innocua]EIS4945550.1 hypothetical protein [Listeria innocua]